MPTFTPQAHAPFARRRRFLAGALAVLSIAACKEFTSVDASYANITDSQTLYALNGSPPGSANAVNLFSGAVFRADQRFGYDIAFDIDATGRVLIIPSKALATSFSGPYSVGLQTVPGSFEALLEAPTDGYRVDTALVVAKGGVVAIESHDLGTCAAAIKGNSYFSKLVVTDVDPVSRKIDVTITVNRNCGFRSFAAGIPRS